MTAPRPARCTLAAVSSGEKVREFFETTVPGELTKSSSLGEGFRCRFHVEGAGAWEIDLRRPPRCIDVHSALGGYDAVIYLSADDFCTLVQSNAASLDELVSSGSLCTSGDTPRALEMISIVVNGPPFVWSPLLRVLPVDAALFRATEEELLQAFPAWRRSVDEMVGHEPAHDDENEASSLVPLAPPFPFVIAPISDQWWDHLLDFYILLVPADEEARNARQDESLDKSEATERVFPAVFAGRGARSNVYGVPQPLAQVLAALSDADCDVFAATLATRLYPASSRPNPFTGVEQDYSEYRERFHANARHGLRDLRELAKTLSAGQALWFWGWFE